MVFRLLVAKSQVRGLLEVPSASSGPPSVDTSHDISFLRESVFPDEPSRVAVFPGVVDLLVARSAVLIHDDRILFCRVEVSRSHHPSIEFHPFRRLERENFRLADVELRVFLLQSFVVFEHPYHLAVRIPECSDIRRVDVGEDIDKVLASLREFRFMSAFFLGEHPFLPLSVDAIDILFERAALIGRIEEELSLSVGAIVIVDDKFPFRQLRRHRPVLVVEIEMPESVALRQQDELSISEVHVIIERSLDIILGFLPDEQPSLSVPRVCLVDVTSVLMPVERDNRHLVFPRHRQHARDISVVVERHVDCLNPLRLQVAAEHHDLCVLLSRLRILIFII